MALYQSYIGRLHWLVGLLRIDLVFGASQGTHKWYLSREKYVMSLCHIFAYIKRHYRSRIIFIQNMPISVTMFFLKDIGQNYTMMQLRQSLPMNLRYRGELFDWVYFFIKSMQQTWSLVDCIHVLLHLLVSCKQSGTQGAKTQQIKRILVHILLCWWMVWSPTGDYVTHWGWWELK